MGMPVANVNTGAKASTKENMAASMAVPDTDSHVHVGHPALLMESMVLLEEGAATGPKRRAIDVEQAMAKLTEAHSDLRQEEKLLTDLLTQAKSRLAALDAAFGS